MITLDNTGYPRKKEEKIEFACLHHYTNGLRLNATFLKNIIKIIQIGNEMAELQSFKQNGRNKLNEEITLCTISNCLYCFK